MSERKLMIVEGYTLPAEIEDATLAWMRGADDFKAHDVVRGLILGGVPPRAVCLASDGYSPAYRIADRLLQRERRAGNIRFVKGRWRRGAEAGHAR